jgi:hypothetical protein
MGRIYNDETDGGNQAQHTKESMPNSGWKPSNT